MNTVKRLEVPIGLIDKLRICKLEDGIDKAKMSCSLSTTNEKLNSFEFDRTFNNIDVLEGLLISSIENPEKSVDVNIDINRFKPHKVYEETITLIGDYDDKIKY